MRNFLLYFAILISIHSSANTVKVFSVKFDRKDFSIIEQEKGGFLITSPVYDIVYDYCQCLPIIGVKFDISDKEEFESFTIESEEVLISDDVKKLLCPEIATTEESTKVEQNYIASSKLGKTNEIVKYVGTYTFADEKKLYFNLYPFRYEASSKKLYLILSIKIYANLKPTNAQLNYQGTSENKKSLFRQGLVDAGDYQYLVITNNLLSPYFEKLVKWKTKKGIKAQIVTVENIYANDNSLMTNTQKIKKFIMDYYNYNNQTLKYVLIGGDLNNVPGQKCDIWFNRYFQGNTTTLESTTTYSDTYYASLKQLDWSSLAPSAPINTEEYDDGLDLSLDICVSRLPFFNGTDIERYVERLIGYERNPNVSNWNNAIFMGGKMLSKLDTINGFVASDVFFIDSILYHNFIAPYWSGGRIRLYDTKSDIPDVNGFTSNNLQTQLSNGFSFVNISTHGSPLSWQTEDGGYFFSDALNLNNNGNTIITTIACHTNEIVSNYGLSRSLFRAENGGILGFWGSSKEGFYYPSGMGPSHRFVGEMYKNLFYSNNQSFYNPYHRLASAVLASKGNLFTYTTLNCAPYRWLYLSMDLMGDPEMPVYTTIPQKLSNITISQDPNSDYVHINPWTYGTFTYCKYVKQSGYEDYYAKEFYRDVEIENIYHTQCNICITSPDHIPYQAIYGQHVQLQGVTFEGDNHIHVDYDTTIGANLTNSYPTGSIVVKDGTLTIQRANGVTISDSFEVKLGAELLIE